MDDVGLVETVLDLTGFDLLQGAGHVHGDGTGLRVRHQALRAQDTAETSDDAHHVGGRNDDVEIKPTFVLDLRDQFFRSDVIGAGSLGFVSLDALGENEDADGLARSVRQHHGAADLLIGVTAVAAGADVGFHGLIELGRGHVLDQTEGFLRIVLLHTIVLG